MGFPDGTSSEEPAFQHRRHKRLGFGPWVGKIPWRRAWQPTPVSLPGEFRGQRSLAGFSPWGRNESDTTEALMHPCFFLLYTMIYWENGNIWYTQVNWMNSGASIWSLVHPWFRTSLFVAVVYLLSCVWFFATPWTVAHHTPLSMGFSRQEDWSGLPFPFPSALPGSGIEPGYLALQVDSLPLSHLGNPQNFITFSYYTVITRN